MTLSRAIDAPWRLIAALLAITSPLAARLSAQQPVADSARPARADSAQANQDDADPSPSLLTTGATGGSLGYYGGRTERAASMIVRLTPFRWLSIAATPTAVSASELGDTGARLTASGVTDVPVEISVGRSFGLPWSPSLALSYGVTIPVGDTATGFGSGRPGSSISVGFGLSPLERFGLHFGAGRSLSDFSVQSTFDGTASIWADAGVWTTVTDRVSLSADYSGDLGAIDPTYGRSGSVGAGASIRVLGPVQLMLNGSHGISGPTPRYSFSIGLGSAFAMFGGASVHARAPTEELTREFGGGRHGLPSTPTSGTTLAPGNSGSAPGHTGTSGSGTSGNGLGKGHGRGKP